MEKAIRIILLIIAMGVMSFSGYKLLCIYSEYAVGDKIYDDYVEKYTVETVDTVETVENLEEEEFSFSIDFNGLLAENEDVVGWIYSEDTPINYPIVQSEDNKHYLRRLLDGSYNIAGSIFMDYKNPHDFTDFNTIIYGHNLRNGAMFSTLKEYNNQEYYEKHPTMYLFAPQAKYLIQLIAGYQTDIYSNIYTLPETEEELELLYEEIIGLSRFEANTIYEKGDRLLTLSTCSDGGDTARYVLIGKIVEE